MKIQNKKAKIILLLSILFLISSCDDSNKTPLQNNGDLDKSKQSNETSVILGWNSHNKTMNILSSRPGSSLTLKPKKSHIRKTGDDFLSDFLSQSYFPGNTSECMEGGEKTIYLKKDDPELEENKVVYNQCKDIMPVGEDREIEVLLNGIAPYYDLFEVEDMFMINGTYAGTYNEFSYQVKDLSSSDSNLVLKTDYFSGMIKGIVSEPTKCNKSFGDNETIELDVPTSQTLKINGTFSYYLDSDGNEQAEQDITEEYNGFEWDISISDYDTRCNPISIKQTGNGAYTLIDKVTPGNDFSITFNNVENHSIYSKHNEIYGFSTITSGQYTYKTDCSVKNYSIITIEPVFVPEGEQETCPIAGKLELTGDISGNIIFNLDGTIDTDDDKDGVSDSHFNSCQTIENSDGLCN